MTTTSKRAAYILANYTLTTADNGETVARSPLSCIRGTDRASVIDQAWARWAHFNFSDEVAAFATVFVR